MQNTKLTTGNMIIVIAGVVIFIASFLNFYEFGDLGFNAWSTDVNLLGVATLPALFGLIMAAQVAATTFGNVNLPDRLLTLTWDQVHLALGFQATIMMIAFLVRDNGFLDFGIGFFLMLLAAVALLVGAVIRQRETAPRF